MTPIPGLSGVSLIQIILLKMIYFGIGGADYLAATGYDYIHDSGGQVSRAESVSKTHELALNMLKPLTVQSYYRLDRGVNHDPFSIVKNFKSRAGHQSYAAYGFAAPDSITGEVSPDAMGRVIVYCDDLKLPSCATRKNALVVLEEKLAMLSDSVFEADGTPAKDFSLNNFNALVTQYAQDYDAAVHSAMISDLGSIDAEYQSELSNFVANAKDMGWGALGTWYWALANFNERSADLFANKTKFKPGDITEITRNSLPDLTDYLGRLDRASNESKREELAEIANSSSDSVFKYLDFSIADPAYRSLSNGDPIANMQLYGQTILDVAYWGFFSYNAVRATTKAGDETVTNSLFSKIPIVGPISKFATSFAKSVVESLAVPLYLLILPIVVLGITLAFYLPSVPFILWTMALIGWLMLVIESLMVAPLWTAAHAIPEGEGMAGQHGKQGYMLFLTVLMRPPLMVFGFFIAVVLMQEVGNFIGNSFAIFHQGLNANYVSGPITFVAMMFVIGGAVVVAAHKVFGLITWLPENAMRWVGQMNNSLGEGQDEQRTRTIFAGAATTAQGARGMTMAGRDKNKPGAGDKPGGNEGDHSPTNSNPSKEKGKA